MTSSTVADGVGDIMRGERRELQDACEKEQLDASDAFDVIRLLQEQALPIFSFRNASVPSSSSTPPLSLLQVGYSTEYM